MQSLTQSIVAGRHAGLAAQRLFTLPAQRPPWTATALPLRRGQAYTLLASGRIQWSRQDPELYGGAGFHLWARVSPGGQVVNVTRDSGSFVADVDGELELGIYLGMWRDRFGTLATPATAYAKLHGALQVLVLVWQSTAQSGLADLAQHISDPALTTEIARLAQPVALPAAWHYLFETGTTDIYRDCTIAAGARICLAADDDQGILRKAVDFPLTPATTLAWRWRLDQHPSRQPENVATSHDYISVGAEFDNGRDLTWIWSSCLAPGTWFACPIKAWSARETHYVVRSGRTAATHWLREARAVHADVAVAMGSPPARIVGIWLICVASFQHGGARAAFADIVLADDRQRLQVL